MIRVLMTVVAACALLALAPMGLTQNQDTGAAPAAAPAPPPPPTALEVQYERYYALSINGQRAGWMVERRTRDAAGLIETASEVRMTLARLGQALETRIGMSFVERDAPDVEGDANAGRGGEPVSMVFLFGDGSSSRRTTYTWTDGAIAVLDEDLDGGRADARVEPLPEGEADDEQWLTPLEIEQFAAKRRAAGATVLSYQTVSPDTGLAVVRIIERHDDEDSQQIVQGRPVTVRRIQSTTSAVPGLVTTTWEDADGVAVMSVTPLGGVELVAELADRETALADFAPPEFMASAFVVPGGVANGEIPRPRSVTRAVYAVRATDGVLPDLPTSGGQTFERTGPGTGVVRVVVSGSGGTPNDLDAYRAATAMADSEDDVIRAFAEKAVRNVEGDDTRAIAEALRWRVYRHINEKSLAAGFASASDAVRDRVGDCTEHACLMVAAARSRGLAARVATGLIYADMFGADMGAELGGAGAFAYHMWVQVWVPGEAEGDGAWVDYDPSWPGRFDGVHIALSTGDLSDGSFVQEAARSARFLGNLEIDVLSLGWSDGSVWGAD